METRGDPRFCQMEGPNGRGIFLRFGNVIAVGATVAFWCCIILLNENRKSAYSKLIDAIQKTHKFRTWWEAKQFFDSYTLVVDLPGNPFPAMLAPFTNEGELLRSSIAHFINDSSDANCRFVQTGSFVSVVATRDIVEGEELLLNYGVHYDRSGF
tara:strand:- start:174 stop:638 length:465 start_codon:yes stop_codon:yes gene_type:complete